MDLGFDEIVNQILETERKQILIGVQEGSITKVQSKNGNTQKAGLNIAQYAAENEFGTDRIPERSFMRTAFDSNINNIEEVASKEIGLVIDTAQTLDRAYQRIGLYVQSLVQIKIRDIRSPPNSPATIAKKKSSKPLIDFGQMIASIRYAIKKAR